MATTKEVHDYIMDSLGNLGIGGFSAWKMMGEYCVYFKDKLIGGIYDDMFLLKPTSSALRLLPTAQRACPYKGSRTQMIAIEEIEKTELFRQLIKAVYDELPQKKRYIPYRPVYRSSKKLFSPQNSFRLPLQRLGECI